MAERPPRASALEPEFLVLGLLCQQPAHGYRLHQRVQDAFGGLWHIPQNQLYNLLRRLEARGDLVGRADDSAAGPPRRVYRPTRRGRARFRRWRDRPTPLSARALRVAFLTRLYLALASDRQVAARLLHEQRRSLEAGLARLRADPAAAEPPDSLRQLSLRFRIRQLETTLAWMAEAQERLAL